MVLRRDATIPEPNILYSGSRQWEGGNSNKPEGGQHTAVGAVVVLGHTGYGRGRLGWRAPAAHSTQRVCGGAAGTIWDITIGGVGAGGGVGTDGSVGANGGVGVGVASASHFVKPDNSRNPTDGKNEMTIEPSIRKTKAGGQETK